MEANRIWHEPVVEVYSNLITPGVCCFAAAYDLANRRWYQLDVGDAAADWHHDTRLDEVPDDEWLSSTNTISTNSSGFPVSFALSEEALVRRPISERFSYGHRPCDKLPTTRFKQLCDKTYLSRGADTCLWDGRRCVFKRVEFDCDVESQENEIRTREAIIQCIERDLGSASEDQNYVMERRFNVVPILAVVLHDETSNWIVSSSYQAAANKDYYLHDEEEDNTEHHHSHQIAGFLMPYAGRSLDLMILGTPAADSTDRFRCTASTSPAMGSSSSAAAMTDLPISEEQLLDLACGIQKLSRCDIVHGDICHWNVVLTQPESTALQAARLLLIDLGDIAPDYEGDADALGNLLLWCLEHSAELKDTTAIRKRIVIAAALLKAGDLDRAIGVLSPSIKTRGGSFNKRPLSSASQEVKRRRLS
ncbi:hypothetical protein QBC46DRAFT_444976 [Diplogelasinospora grovesii]|uniref:non-specific serine/threonine protein kinase n=1 Tax=Diplogelasinospora grovesii TaxID=303347 RepID=A0AAN6NIT6_9PEZI|nr:hypothetical protein QBC46DRAFT_444976 [Diplogelasinospora grovesii]